jgi:phosphohistidine phosphatase
MQVLLVRHATAVDASRLLSDDQRFLSPRGRDEARALGGRLRDHCQPTLIWSSPLVRAVQTAELVAAELRFGGTIETVAALAVDGSVREVQRQLAAVDPGAMVLLFGHEPSISGLGALLTGQARFAAVRKAQAVRIDGNRLLWRMASDDDAPVVEGSRR